MLSSGVEIERVSTKTIGRKESIRLRKVLRRGAEFSAGVRRCGGGAVAAPRKTAPASVAVAVAVGSFGRVNNL